MDFNQQLEKELKKMHGNILEENKKYLKEKTSRNQNVDEGYRRIMNSCVETTKSNPRHKLLNQDVLYKNIRRISKKEIVNKVNLLDKSINSQCKSKKRQGKNYKKSAADETGIYWDSPMYVIKSIRQCILKHDWENLTHLLIMMLNHNKLYLPYVKLMSLRNFLRNPADYDGNVFEEFVQLCFVDCNLSDTKDDLIRIHFRKKDS